MSDMDAEQLALDGLAPAKRRKRAPAQHTPATENPIAQVVIDVQATHLGQTFDYLIDEKDSEAAQPGVLVRLRFGGQRVNGVIWDRVASSDTPQSSLRYIERVISPDVLAPASMREDIGLIADAYGGTRANIIRLAVPPRVAKVEAEQRLAASFRRAIGGNDTSSGFVGRDMSADQLRNGGMTLAPAVSEAVERGFKYVSDSYSDARVLRDALGSKRFASFVLDTMPGVGEWERVMSWAIGAALAAGRRAVVCLPTMREVNDMAVALQASGLKMFAPAASGGWTGDIAILNAQMPPADRYRAYLAIALGQVSVVLGTRAVMYAPVEGAALFAIYEDAAYQNADGFMPYANARGVMRLRAKTHDGVFLCMANARSAQSQWEVAGPATTPTLVSGYSTEIHPLASVLKDATPWVRWLNREELARLADSTMGSRVPHTAVNVVNKALERGPVLLSIPSDGVTETMSCAKCHAQARCPRCSGPLQKPSGSGEVQPRCRWCGVASVNWKCPNCKGERMRVVRVGAAGTAKELAGLFRGVPVVLSSPSQPKGVVASVPNTPAIVVATPGAEPRVQGVDGMPGEYRAVAILDAWTSLYALGVDAREDILTAWMRAASLCAPRSRGGQVLILGETDSTLAQAMMLWDSRMVAAKDLAERAQTAMPPLVAAACVWGRRSAVNTALRNIGVTLGGDWFVCPTPFCSEGDEQPGALGPVVIPLPRTVDAREFDGTDDRVKAVVRVPQSKRAELALRLRAEVARHVAAREAGELRFQVDPKDLI